jgi:hypothetical protein
MSNFKQRIKRLDATDVASLMNFNKKDISFGNSGEMREILNIDLTSKFENEEIDEIELLIIEDGM